MYKYDFGNLAVTIAVISNLRLEERAFVRVIHNQLVAFRLPNVLRETLEELALENDMHLSELIRLACMNLVRASKNEISGNHSKTGN